MKHEKTDHQLRCYLSRKLSQHRYLVDSHFRPAVRLSVEVPKIAENRPHAMLEDTAGKAIAHQRQVSAATVRRAYVLNAGMKSSAVHRQET